MASGKNDSCWIGFDLGGTKMLAAVFNSNFKIIGRKRRKTRSHEGVEAGLRRMVETAQAAMEDAGVARDRIRGIGIGSPGPLDLEAGEFLATPNLEWERAPLKAHFESAFDVPTVVLNDVDAGVYGEYRLGAARDARCVVGLFPGTGIGGGCVYEGRLLRGATQSAFEIGHLPLVPDGPLCGCGRRGCLEAVASRLAVASAAAAAAYRGEAPHLLEEVGTELSKITSGALSRSVAAGDKSVEQILRAAARWLGRGVAVAVNLLAPDTVVLGGGLVEAMPKLFLGEVRKAARAHVMPSFEETFRVVEAKLGDDASVSGAAAWARETVKGGGKT